MKAYIYCASFEKCIGNSFTNNNMYGTLTAEKADSVKEVVLKYPQSISFFSDGYRLATFDFALVDPDIAPMNREDT